MPEEIKQEAWEQTAAQLQAKVDELAAALSQTREALDASERRRHIDGELAASEAMDIETARLLTEAAVAQMEKPDVARAVADLKKRKPFLFRRKAPASAMSAGARPAQDEISRLAEEARTTGDKRALLKYLRARRGS